MVRRGRYNFSKSVHNLNGGKQKQKKKGRLLKTDSVIIVFFGGERGEFLFHYTV